MSKISVQQRKYFTQRIEEAINEKINILKQQRAADVQKLSEAEYNRYLKNIKLDKSLTAYKKLKDKYDLLAERIVAVYDEILKTMSKNRYDSGVPTIYAGSNYKDMDKAFRYLCGQTALGQESETASGRLIKELQHKKKTACDVLHGINELDGLTAEVNKILKGADVPLLGE